MPTATGISIIAMTESRVVTGYGRGDNERSPCRYAWNDDVRLLDGLDTRILDGEGLMKRLKIDWQDVVELISTFYHIKNPHFKRSHTDGGDCEILEYPEYVEGELE